MKQQTAVEWLEDKIQKLIDYQEGNHKAEPYTITQLSNDVQQAKQMEKDQMMDAYSYGMGETCQWNPLDSMFDHYYNETFKSE